MHYIVLKAIYTFITIPILNYSKPLEPVRSSKIYSDEVVFRLFDSTMIGKKSGGW